MKARAVSLRSSPSSTHHLSWLSPPHSLSLIAATLHSASLGIPLLRSPPNGVVTLLTHCPSWLSLSSIQRPLGSPSSAHRRSGLSPSSITLPRGRLPSHPLLSWSSPSSTDSSTLRPFGSPPSPAEGPDLQLPCTLLPSPVTLAG